MVENSTYQEFTGDGEAGRQPRPKGRGKNRSQIRNEIEWENVFDSIPDFIFILDKKYRIVKTNRAVAERLGRNVAGLTCFTCIHKLDYPHELCPHTRLLADGQEHTAEIYEEILGGHFLVTTSPIRDPKGRLTGSVPPTLLEI